MPASASLVAVVKAGAGGLAGEQDFDRCGRGEITPAPAPALVSAVTGIAAAFGAARTGDCEVAGDGGGFDCV